MILILVKWGFKNIFMYWKKYNLYKKNNQLNNYNNKYKYCSFKLLNILILWKYFIRYHLFEKYNNDSTFYFYFISICFTIFFDTQYIFIYILDVFVLCIMKWICTFLLNKDKKAKCKCNIIRFSTFDK